MVANHCNLIVEWLKSTITSTTGLPSISHHTISGALYSIYSLGGYIGDILCMLLDFWKASSYAQGYRYLETCIHWIMPSEKAWSYIYTDLRQSTP